MIIWTHLQDMLSECHMNFFTSHRRPRNRFLWLHQHISKGTAVLFEHQVNHFWMLMSCLVFASKFRYKESLPLAVLQVCRSWYVIGKVSLRRFQDLWHWMCTYEQEYYNITAVEKPICLNVWRSRIETVHDNKLVSYTAIYILGRNEYWVEVIVLPAES